MNTSQSSPQITLPTRRPNLLTRRRLIELLDAVIEKRLILVSAPAGYGKTSLLVDFAHHTDLPVAWYSLSERERDPHQFLHLLGAAITRPFPEVGNQTRAYLESHSDAALDFGLVCTQLVNEISASISEHFLLIFDDVQFIEDESEIIGFLNQFTQEVTENCHLILASRALPVLPDLPSMVADRQVAGISFEELAFRAEEVRALILQNSGQSISAEEAADLTRASEGWITGLILSTYPRLQGGAERLRHARVSGLGLYDYLARQVLDSCPSELRAFLLETAILGEFDNQICEAVVGAERDWHDLIDQASHQNLFLQQVGDGSPMYRYHRLFRDFLRNVRWREDPEGTRALLQRLAGYYIGRREWVLAHDALRRSGIPEWLAAFIRDAGTQLAREGRIKLLSVWLNELPPDLLESDPGLSSLQGIVRVMMGDTAIGLSLLDRAIAELGDSPNNEDFIQALLRRTYARRFQGDFRGAIRDSEEVIQLTESLDGREAALARAEAFHARGTSQTWLGQYERALGSLSQASHLYNMSGDTMKVAMLQIDRGFTHHRAGQYRDALVEYKEALRFWEAKNNLVHQATLNNNLAVLHHAMGEYDFSLNGFELAIEKSRGSGYRRMEALSLAGIGDLYSDLDVLDAAREAYAQAREIAQEIDFQFLVFYLDLAEAVQAQRQGDLALAQELQRLAGRYLTSSQSIYEKGLYHLHLGQLLWFSGEHTAAAEKLESALQLFQEIDQEPERSIARLYLGGSYHFGGREADRDQQIEAVLRSPAAGHQSHLLTVHARRIVDALLSITFENARLNELLAEFIARVQEFRQKLPQRRRVLRPLVAAVPMSPPALNVRALGIIEVRLDDRPIETSDWGSLVARDMLFCLLAHPDGLTREALGGIFWPELEPNRAKNRFKNTIYRMRRAVDQPVAVLQDQRYQFNWELDYAYDVESFERTLAEAKRESDPEAEIRRYQEAVSLYGGDYLPGLGYPWVYGEREQLRVEYVGAALTLGDLYLEKGRARDALDCSFRVFEVERAHEGGCRLALRAHAAMGNRPAVIRQFQRCQQYMLEDYQVDLSPETVELFEYLIGM